MRARPCPCRSNARPRRSGPTRARGGEPRRSTSASTRSPTGLRRHRGRGAPEAGFFLWLPVEDGEAAALKLWRETGVRVLPGAYLSREVNGDNPGAGYIRVAMVAEEHEMQRGLEAIRDCLMK
jgi:alanine-alpha-ketoisovalerate/valine-pyruvate aminotransferase